MNILKHKTLLYAEDELEVQKQYVQYFKNYFESVFLASNGKDALDIYSVYKPDVIILDINMPHLSGLEVAQKIRQTNHDVAIVLLTAKSDKKTLMNAMELELTTYLEKPVLRNDLKEALQKIETRFTKINIKKLWIQNNDYYTWDTILQKLFYKNEEIRLTKKEIILFDLFAQSNGNKISYQEIYNVVWADDIDKKFSESTIKTLLSGLRKKLPPKVIENVYGQGYILLT